MSVLCLSVGARQYVSARLAAWPSTLGGFSQWTIRQLSPATAQSLFLVVLLLLLVGLFVVAFRPAEEKEKCRYSGFAFAVMVFGLLFFVRWPSYAILSQLSPDESQVLAGALRLQKDFSYFRTVDGTTHGPLLSYVVWLPTLFGLPIDLSTGRLVQTLLQIATLLAFWRAVATYSTERSARLVTTPLVIMYACLTDVEYLHNTSEQVPMFCLALGLFGLAKLQDCGSSRLWRWSLFTGLVLGAIPMAKLQAVPAGLVLGFTAVGYVLSAAAKEARLKGFAMLVLGAFLPTLCLVLPTLWGGGFHEFLKGYILGNLDYSGTVRLVGPKLALVFPPVTFWSRVGSIPEIFGSFPQWQGFFCTQVLLVALAAYLSPNEVWGSRGRRVALVVSVLLFMASLWEMVVPGTGFLHYIYLLLVPTSAVAAVVIGATIHKWSLRSQGAALGLVVFGTIWGAGVPGYSPSMLQKAVASVRSLPKVWVNPVASVALDFAEPGEYLGLWGWCPEVWVTGGFVPATRDLVGERLIEPRFDLTYYRKRFLEELKQTKPPVFVDVTGIRNSFYYHPELYGYETFPELKGYLEKNYRYMGEIPDGFGRLFVSRQRLKELEPLRSRETN